MTPEIKITEQGKMILAAMVENPPKGIEHSSHIKLIIFGYKSAQRGKALSRAPFVYCNNIFITIGVGVDWLAQHYEKEWLDACLMNEPFVL